MTDGVIENWTAAAAAEQRRVLSTTDLAGSMCTERKARKNTFTLSLCTRLQADTSHLLKGSEGGKREGRGKQWAPVVANCSGNSSPIISNFKSCHSLDSSTAATLPSLTLLLLLLLLLPQLLSPCVVLHTQVVLTRSLALSLPQSCSKTSWPHKYVMCCRGTRWWGDWFSHHHHHLPTVSSSSSRSLLSERERV